MKILWTILFSAYSFVDNISSARTDFVAIKDNWRKECLENFFITFHFKSIGILYKEDTSFQHNSILKSIANRGISSSIFELPIANFSDLIKVIKAWKSLGIHHILFLHRMDNTLLHLWMQLLREICDDTWWLFYAEEASRKIFEKALESRNCVTDRWAVYSTNCSTCEKPRELFTSDVCMLQTPSNASFLSDVNSPKSIFEGQRDSRKIIRLVVSESPPYLIVHTNEDGTITLEKGPDAELLRVIAEKLRLEYKIVLSPDGEWGRMRKGNWTGLVGMLKRKEADMASGCVTITYNRFGAILFSVPYDVQKSVIISRIPGLKSKTYAALLPFTYDVWLMVCFTLFLFLVLFYGIGKAYGIFYFRKTYKLDRIFWYMIGTICSEGGWLTFEIQGTVTVFLLGVWLLFVLVMQASYCGTLMSVLTFPSYEHSIDTLSDLARAVVEKGYKCGCLKGTINCDTLTELKGHLKVVADAANSDKKNFVRSVEDGLNKVLEEKFVFIAQEVGSIYRAQLMPDPYFSMSDEGLDIELFSIALRHGLPYMKDINEMILRLVEAGIIAKWRDDLVSVNDMKFASQKGEVTEMDPLSLNQLTGALYMFFYGLLFAFIVFAFECIGAKYFKE